MIDTSIFPYKNLPIRLEFGEKKSVTVCYFDCDYHLQKYIDRYKLDRKNIAISCRDEDEEPDKSSKTDKKNVQQGAGKNSNGSTSTNRKRTKSVDTNSNIPRTRKSKKQ
jgi:hypothetical protein